MRSPKCKGIHSIIDLIRRFSKKRSKGGADDLTMQYEWDKEEQSLDCLPADLQYPPSAGLASIQLASPSPSQSIPPSLSTVQHPTALRRTSLGLRVTICPYDPGWAHQFSAIANDLQADLADEQAPFLHIEHIGSTSIPGISAKPIIDIAIVVDRIRPFTHPSDPTISYVDKVHYALIWGKRPGGYQYTGDGGVKGRPSFKLFRPDLPWRNVYLIEEGSILDRSYKDFKRVLCDDANRDLKLEYGKLKERLAEREWEDVMEYAQAKDEVIGRVLRRAGWTGEMIRQKEGLVSRNWDLELPY